jgi:hypothetical protein
MGIFDFGKEQEIQKGLEELFEGKLVKISKEELIDFLQKDIKQDVTEIVAPVQETKEVEDVEEVFGEEPSIEQSKIVENPHPSFQMDRFLEEYEDQPKPTVANTGNSYLAYGGGGENNSIVEVGSGVGLYKDKDGPRLRLKTLMAAGTLSIIDNGDTVTFSANVVENITSQIVSYSATSADDIILCSASNVTLPTASDVENKIFNVKNRSETDQAIVDVIGGGTIDKETSQIILALDNLKVVSDGTEYWIL